MALIMEEQLPSPDAPAPVEGTEDAWLPAALDDRLRLVLAASAVAFLVVGAVAVLVLHGLDGRRVAGTALLLFACVSLWRGARRSRPLLLDVVEAGLLASGGLVVGNARELEFVFLLALAGASLHRRGTPRAVTWLAYSAGLLSVELAVDGAGALEALTVHGPRLLLAGFLPVLIGEFAELAERAVARERILARAGRDLATVQDVDRLGAIAAEAAHALVRDAGVQGAVTASLFVGSGPLHRIASVGDIDRELVDVIDRASVESVDLGSPSTRVFGDRAVMAVVLGGPEVDAALAAEGLPTLPTAHALLVPLFARDTLRGLISVALDEAPHPSLCAALENLGVDTVLALDAIESATGAAARERHVHRLLAHSHDAITVLDAQLVVTYESTGSRLLGWPQERIVGTDVSFLLHPDDAAHVMRTLERSAAEPGVPLSCEWRALHLDGHWVHLETIVTNCFDDDDVRGFLLNSRDVSERKALEEHIAHQSLHDPVTGLSNRTLFVDRVAHALERSKRRARVPAVCFLDLDGFKQVNETYGHEVGDQLLQVIADRLRGTLREGDTAARFGGDEFAILMEEVDDAQVGAVVERLHEALCMPVVVDNRTLMVKATIGVATPHPAWTSRELLQAVDAALYVAKRESRGGWRRYDDSLPKPGEQDGLLAALQEAVEGDQLRLQYQPVVNLETGAISAVEALVRWHHRDMGMIPPNAFIPLAERSGLIVPIGRWVLETATRQLRRWHDAFPDREPLSIHVNVSAVQLADPGAVDVIGDVIKRSGVSPEHITLEITESVLVADPVAAASQLNRLKDLGVKLAIDDFGVGYAGIGYLREFSVDQLKIDKSFVDTLSASGDTELFEAMLGFSQAFRLDTVAEGVEHAEQAEVLMRLGCTNAQGYHFARPLDPLDLEGLLGRTEPLAIDAPPVG